MQNWSTNEKEFKLENKSKHAIWKLEQMVNFGLGKGEKLSVSQLKKYWNHIEIDKSRRKLLKVLLYDK